MLTVKEAFNELLRRVELNPTRVQLASTRYNAVKAHIEQVLPGKSVVQVGSFKRRTKIRPIDLGDALDVDARVEFGTAYNFATGSEGITPQRAIEIVSSALSANKTYKLMAPVVDMPVVVLEYADQFKIELTPAFVDKLGQHNHADGVSCFLIPRNATEWMTADYDYDASIITGINQSADVAGILVPTIKMLKSFLRPRDLPISSFHVEVLAARVIPGLVASWAGKSWGLEHILAGFLSQVGASLNGAVGLPGSYSQPVDLKSSSVLQRQRCIQCLSEWGQVAWDICGMTAVDQEKVRAWRQFFGDPFPAS